jgi:hypothetical protein
VADHPVERLDHTPDPEWSTSFIAIAVLLSRLQRAGRRGPVLGAPCSKSRRSKVQPWRKWGKSLSITYCVGLLLLQGVLIVQSLGVAIPLDLSAIGRGLGVLLAIMCLLAINQMPKLPWFERRFAPGGNLGPIYGPRYMRTQSRILVVFMIAVIAYSLAAPPTMAWRSASYILLAAALVVVWSITWRIQLGRRWRLRQPVARG